MERYRRCGQNTLAIAAPTDSAVSSSISTMTLSTIILLRKIIITPIRVATPNVIRRRGLSVNDGWDRVDSEDLFATSVIVEFRLREENRF